MHHRRLLPALSESVFGIVLTWSWGHYLLPETSLALKRHLETVCSEILAHIVLAWAWLPTLKNSLGCLVTWTISRRLLLL